MTSNRLPLSREKRSPLRTLTLSLFLSALASVHRTASGLMSMAVTSAPALAAHKATTPDPQPISRNDLPWSGSDETNFARMELEPKYFGWKTPGYTSRSSFSTRVRTDFFDRSFSQYLRTTGCNRRRRRPQDNMREIGRAHV